MPRYAQFYKVAASIQRRRLFFERMGWESNKYKTIGHILSKGIEKEPFFLNWPRYSVLKLQSNRQNKSSYHPKIVGLINGRIRTRLRLEASWLEVSYWKKARWYSISWGGSVDYFSTLQQTLRFLRRLPNCLLFSESLFAADPVK